MKSLTKAVYAMKYYSFYIGWPDSRHTEWILLDYKMPSLDLKSAIVLHYFAETIFINKSHKNRLLHTAYLKAPNRNQIIKYRLILEFEKKFTPKKGKTTHYYKLLKKYNPWHFREMFDTAPKQLI